MDPSLEICLPLKDTVMSDGGFRVLGHVIVLLLAHGHSVRIQDEATRTWMLVDEAKRVEDALKGPVFLIRGRLTPPFGVSRQFPETCP